MTGEGEEWDPIPGDAQDSSGPLTEEQLLAGAGAQLAKAGGDSE